MVHTYSDNDKIYLVDLMIAYVNIFDYPVTHIDTKDYLPHLKSKCWRKFGKKYSPIEVLNNPSIYDLDMEKIKNAEVGYPIIIFDGNVVDGMHRLTKLYLQQKSHLKAYVFNEALMKKFLVSAKGDYKKLESLEIHHIIEMFNDRFTIKK
jgi:disulfide oxidoreductase YuzD